MRRLLIPLLAAAFVLSCADAPTTPLSVAAAPLFGTAPGPAPDGDPPPPWAMIEGGGTTAENAFTYTANFFVSPPGNIAWLKFTGGTGVTFSSNARIMSVNGNVSGTGTLTTGGQTYQLSSVSTFTFSANCTTTPTVSCASFTGSGFASGGSFYTGRYAGGNRPNNPGPPIDECQKECVIICPDCVYVDNPKGNGRGR